MDSSWRPLGSWRFISFVRRSKDWKFSADGDDRGTETLSFQYDRVAMNYVSTGDGKIFLFGNPRGWDQTEHKPWDWGNNWDKFLKRIK